MTKKKKNLTATDFQSLSDEEKEAIFQECEAVEAHQGRPLTKAQQRSWRNAKTSGRGRHSRANVEVVSLGLEKDLLNRTDELAKKEGVTRSALVTKGLQKVLAEAV